MLNVINHISDVFLVFSGLIAAFSTMIDSLCVLCGSIERLKRQLTM